MHYVLDDDSNPVRECSSRAWGRFMADHLARRVALTTVHSPWATLEVSTVFLGLDHGLGRHERPVLFETMVLAEPRSSQQGGIDGEIERYCTWDEAEMGHKRMVARVKASILPPAAGAEPCSSPGSRALAASRS